MRQILVAFLLALFPSVAMAQNLPGPFIIENKLGELNLLGAGAQAAAQTNLGLGAMGVPLGIYNSNSQPSSPTPGTLFFNGTVPGLQVWTGSAWLTLGSGGGGGGNVTIGTTPIINGTSNGLLSDNGGVAGIIAPADNGVGVTNGSGVFSISTTLPSGLNLGTPSALNLANATGYPVGSSSVAGIVKTDGSTIMATAGTISCTTATATQIGCGKPDNATIVEANGVWSAVGSSATAVTIGVTDVVGGTSGNFLYQNGGLLESEAPSSLATTVNGVSCALTQACTVTAAPGGSAGGDLLGTYPNPTVARVNGGLVPASAPALASNGSSQIIVATTTGSGGVVLATSPNISSANLNTPSAINLSNATALPATALPNVGAAAINIGNGTSVETDTLTAGSGVTIVQSGGAVTISSTAAPPGGTTSQVQYNAGSGTFGGFTLGGDATLNVATGAITVTKTNGANFAASATTDTTNAGNISSGTLAPARLPIFSSSTAGAVPASGGGSTTYLNASGTWTTPSGSGTVTSVGATVPSSLLAVSGSPVTSSGTLAFSLVNQSANCVFAGPSSGSASSPSCRSLVGADLPNPTASSLGGIESVTSVANEWVSYIDTSGIPHQSQPSASNLSNGVTGSGSVVLATSPTLVTPALGTPSAIVLTNATGLPCAALPALTGDATSSAGACATSVVKVNGASVPASASVVGTNGSGQIISVASQTANYFLAAPNGSSGAPTFRAIAAPDLPLATTGAFGAVKPDGTTITISGGVISSSGGVTWPTNGYLMTADGSTPTGIAPASAKCAMGNSTPTWAAIACAPINPYPFTAGGTIPATYNGVLTSGAYIPSGTSISAPLTQILPISTNFPEGFEFTVWDGSGSLTSTNTLTLQANASDHITQGSSTSLTSVVISRGGGYITFKADGAHNQMIVTGEFAANSEIADSGAGVTVGSPTGGAQGVGTLNATGLYVNGVAVGTGGSGTVGSGTTGQVASYASSGTTVGGTSTPNLPSGGAYEINSVKVPTSTPYSVGWVAGQNPNGAIIVADLPYAVTLSSVVARVETALGSTGTVAVYIAPSGTACASGTNVGSTTFNANGTAATNQSLTLSTTAVPAGDSVCLQTTGSSWTSGASIMTVTAYANPS